MKTRPSFLRTSAPITQVLCRFIWVPLLVLVFNNVALATQIDCIESGLRSEFVATNEVDTGLWLNDMKKSYANIAYLATDATAENGLTGLVAYDISDPDAPVQVNQWTSSQELTVNAIDIFTTGFEVYILLATQERGLVVLVHNGVGIYSVGELTNQYLSNPKDVLVDNDNAIAFIVNSNHIYAVNLSDPNNPTWMTSGGDPYFQPYSAYYIDGLALGKVSSATSRRTLFVVGRNTEAEGLHWRLSYYYGNPSSDIQMVGGDMTTIDGGGPLKAVYDHVKSITWVASTAGIHAVDSNANVFTANHGSNYPAAIVLESGQATVVSIYGTLARYDISFPEDPSFISQTDFDGYPVAAISVSSGLLWAVNQTSPGSLGALSHLTLVASPEVLVHDLGFALQDVKVLGDIALLAAGDSGLWVSDLSSPAEPRLVYAFQPYGSAEELSVDGDLACVAAEAGGALLFDISAPSVPVYLSQIDVSSHIDDVALSQGVAYMSGNNGLIAFDVTDPQNPILLDECGLQVADPYQPTTYHDVAVAGDRAYLGYKEYQGGTGIAVVDVSDPQNCAIVDVWEYDSTGWPTEISIDRTTAYIADYGEGVVVADLTNPDSPVEIARLRVPTSKAVRVEIAGNSLFVGCRSGAICFFDVTDPANPQSLDYIETPDIRGMDAANGSIYFASRSGLGKTAPLCSAVLPRHAISAHFIRDGQVHELRGGRFVGCVAGDNSEELIVEIDFDDFYVSNLPSVSPSDITIDDTGHGFTLCDNSTADEPGTPENGYTVVLRRSKVRGYTSCASSECTELTDFGESVGVRWNGNLVGAIADLAVGSPDITGDGAIDLADVSRWSSQMGLSIGDSGFDGAADLAPDGVVNLADLGVFVAHLGHSGDPDDACGGAKSGHWSRGIQASSARIVLTQTQGQSKHGLSSYEVALENGGKDSIAAFEIKFSGSVSSGSSVTWTAASVAGTYSVYSPSRRAENSLGEVVGVIGDTAMRSRVILGTISVQGMSRSLTTAGCVISAIGSVADKNGFIKSIGDTESPLVPKLIKTGVEGVYPNPFNPSTTISYTIATDTQVEVNIYDVGGRLVRRLVSEFQEARREAREVRWNGTSDSGDYVPSGVYFWSFSADGLVQTGRMLLLK